MNTTDTTQVNPVFIGSPADAIAFLEAHTAADEPSPAAADADALRHAAAILERHFGGLATTIAVLQAKAAALDAHTAR